MSVKKIIISDNINLNIIETEKFKTNYFSVNFITKLKKDVAALNALIPMILKRGSAKYPNILSISKKLEELYAASFSANIKKQGENQILCFSSYTLNDKYINGGINILTEILDFFGEIIFNPLTEEETFKNSYVESEKNNLSDMIKSQINDKKYYAVKRCQEEMCKDEVYGIPETGTIGDVQKITSGVLYKQYIDVINTSEIEMFFVGKCDIEQFTNKVKNLLKPIKHEKLTDFNTEVVKTVKEVKIISEDQPVAQGKLSLGFRTGITLADHNYHVFTVFNEIFGHSPVSKLFLNVREKLSLCYYCSSIPEPIKGIMIVTSGIEVENKEKVQSEILLQLENMKNGSITLNELDAAKNSIINNYNEISDNPSYYKDWYLNRILAGRFDSPDDAAEMIKTVTIDDIIEIAKNIKLDTVYFLRGTLTEESENNDDSQ